MPRPTPSSASLSAAPRSPAIPSPSRRSYRSSPRPRSRTPRELFEGVYRKRTLTIWVMWFCSYLVANGMITWLPTLYRQTFNLPLETTLLYGLLTSIAGVVAALFCAFLIDKVGRKRWYTGAFLLAPIPLIALSMLGATTADAGAAARRPRLRHRADHHLLALPLLGGDLSDPAPGARHRPRHRPGCGSAPSPARWSSASPWRTTASSTSSRSSPRCWWSGPSSPPFALSRPRAASWKRSRRSPDFLDKIRKRGGPKPPRFSVGTMLRQPCRSQWKHPRCLGARNWMHASERSQPELGQE